MRCLFVVEGVRQRARKSPRFRESAEWGVAWQGRWIVSHSRQHFEVCFRALSPNRPMDFAAALFQICLAEVVVVMSQQIPSAYHPRMVRVTSQNPQSALRLRAASKPRENSVAAQKEI